LTAPIWIAAPPEVHSTLLSSGPGPGPLLAAAAAWSALSTEYAEIAEALAAVLAGVQAGAWDGPSAASYVAAHTPYLAWLTQASAESAATAAQQETAAATYTTALATMPTLLELAANHATHAVLLATNFFGINTIPIALNEADYVRMWIQAAAVMSTYQELNTALLEAVSHTPSAPDIVNVANVLAKIIDGQFPLPQDQQSDFFQWLEQLGYIEYYDTYLQPLIDALFESPYIQSMFAGFDPYLPLLGNPLSFLSPFNIAFALGYPMDIGSYAAYLAQTFFYISLDLTAAVASGNPTTIGFTILFVTVEAVGTIITDTIALLKTLLEQTIVLITVLVPLLTATLAPLATGAVLAPIGIKGLVALAAVPPPPPPVTPTTPPLAALGPNIPTCTSSPAQAPLEVTAPTPTPGAPPPAIAPPPVTGAGVGLGLGMESYGYLVGDLSSAAKRAAGTAARLRTPEPDDAQAPAPAARPHEPAGTPKRRRTKVKQLGRGYEYADLEPDDAPDASDRGAKTLGFTGTVPLQKTATAAGLAALDHDAFGGTPRMPMVPGTWSAQSGPDPA
jgi:PPE-repeat protein